MTIFLFSYLTFFATCASSIPSVLTFLTILACTAMKLCMNVQYTHISGAIFQFFSQFLSKYSGFSTYIVPKFFVACTSSVPLVLTFLRIFRFQFNFNRHITHTKNINIFIAGYSSTKLHGT